MPRFGFDNTYVRDLPAAWISRRPLAVPAPRLLFANHPLADELSLPAGTLEGPDAAALFTGNLLPDDAEPIAQAYAGHQFGHFSPQLGDGRALLLGEVVDRHGRRRDIAFKGSGRTPFSRGGDGKAAVGPMLREALIGEAMHALGIPTTRALAVAATGERVFRDTPLPGAVLTRVAASHLRVGTFQYFAARGDLEMLARLADYTIARHDPQLAGAPDRHLGLLRAVAGRQAQLIAQWMNVGFIHGVMNTDNMALSGETIDYGPCAFMEAYDPATVFSSIDHHGRYAYANQPAIAQWNLARFAETLLPLMASPDDEPAMARAVADATAVIDEFPGLLDAALRAGQREKLGLADATADDLATDAALADDWLALLQSQRVDFTLAWRHLAIAADGRREPLRDLFLDRAALDTWLARWQARCDRSADPAASRADRMRRASPAVIPRNHLVEEALDAATEGDLSPFEALMAALRSPWDEAALQTRYGAPAPSEVTEGYRTFCGT
ncbi:protein adenylyltransferase SelO [Roseateles cellulosilyticus]|uniref:Protein nucleotidyltransferase YdiU n=1 Tax=Pelomonas cellulosilytica TaxID=2906762 RepID=A0ABS8XTZ3_9BURK|nr:YdiU family protein [Pelomonas sp. P8]MCE4554770.1 YdiU family protein [Pelomonas sp. P8]